ncbi:MAG: hypothetical protein AB1668_06560 [Nanoarchaeota archaeon]
MTSLRTKQLLTKAAHALEKERVSVSVPEIQKKINEIKYLSSQKKVPRLTLRKEIIHLESQLQKIVGLEKQLVQHKKQESAKITALKRQITILKNKLQAAGDKELSKKVEKLSHLLGEHLARREMKQEVALSRFAEKAGEERKTAEERTLSREGTIKVKALQSRLNALKNELKIHSELESKSPDEIKLIEAKIERLEDKLREFYEKHPELLVHEIGTINLEPELMLKEEAGPQLQARHEMIFPTPSPGRSKKESKQPHFPPPQPKRK